MRVPPHQRLLQISPNLLSVFHAHAQPQQRLRQMLLSGNRGAAFHRGLHGAEAGGVADELDAGADGVGILGGAADVEGDDGAEAGQLGAGDGVGGV